MNTTYAMSMHNHLDQIAQFDLDMGVALKAAMDAPIGSAAEAAAIERLNQLLEMCDIMLAGEEM